MSASVENVSIPKSNDFDQKTARRLLHECGTIVVENFPPGSEFGIDLSIHYTGDKFIGLKMVPPGVHFVHYSLVSGDGRVAPRCGFFYSFARGEVLVAKWDANAEDIVLETDGEQMERIKLAVEKRQLDARLGAYQFSTYDTWVSLSDYITSTILERLNPTGGRIYSASALVYEPNQDGSVTPKVDNRGLPEMIPAPETVIRYYSHPPKHFLYPPNASPAEISLHSMDSSYTLAEMLRLRGDQWPIMLGEMQFAFIVFLLGHQFEGFEFWRDIVRLLCHGQQALADYRDLYLAFIRVVYFQLKQTNEAIFADIVDNENVIFQCFRKLVENVREAKEAGLDAELSRRIEGFVKSLKNSMKWKLDQEEAIPYDELPAVVDLTSSDYI